MTSDLSAAINVKKELRESAASNIASNQPTDLSFAMYSEKRTDSPNPMYRNNIDPFLGAGVGTNSNSPNDGPTQLKQEEFDPSLQSNPFVSTTAALKEELSSSLSPFISSTVSHSLPTNSSVSERGIPRTRPGSGPASAKYNSDRQLATAIYRPSSANSFSSSNKSQIPDFRASPAPMLPSNAMNNSKLSTAVHSPQDRSRKNAFVTPKPDYNSSTSAFKPLPMNHPNQIYSHQQAPSPHSFPHGPSPPLPGAL